VFFLSWSVLWLPDPAVYYWRDAPQAPVFLPLYACLLPLFKTAVTTLFLHGVEGIIFAMEPFTL